MIATLNTTLATPLAQTTSRLARLYARIKRSRAKTRARRALGQVDARTLRDIGFRRRDIAVLKIVSSNG